MKLADFSINNYRSITTARKIQTNNMTVLVGKNNEGKSNILRALSLAMMLMKIYCRDTRPFSVASREYLKSQYSWERDYPISLQEKNPNGSSSVDFNFALDDADIYAIKGLTGIRLSSSIPVRVSTNGTTAKIDIPKRGTPAFSNTENKKKIIEYVCFKIDFNFIPAIRTESDALRVIDNLIDRSLASLNDDPEYIEAVQKVTDLEQRVSDALAGSIYTPLKNYLPSVKGIQIRLPKDTIKRNLRRHTEIIIDDGVPTPIQQKGDGIKSLTALAMLNIPALSDRLSVIAIEEPESHLHPESARQLYETIQALSETHQVVLTTHSPLFVNRINLSENIIVDNGKATPVKKVKEIRDILGIHVSDNLTNAEHVLVVEGEDDKIALTKILSSLSEVIKKSISDGTLIIDYLAGASNLSYKLTYYRGIQCKYHVLLDNDDAGRHAFEVAQEKSLLDIKNVTYTICNGSPNSELEDCYKKVFYEKALLEEFGVDIDVSAFRGNDKWSDRMANCFLSQGKPWTETVKKRVKLAVAEAVPEDAGDALNEHKCSSIHALVTALENLLINT